MARSFKYRPPFVLPADVERNLYVGSTFNLPSYNGWGVTYYEIIRVNQDLTIAAKVVRYVGTWDASLAGGMTKPVAGAVSKFKLRHDVGRIRQTLRPPVRGFNFSEIAD